MENEEDNKDNCEIEIAMPQNDEERNRNTQLVISSSSNIPEGVWSIFSPAILSYLSAKDLNSLAMCSKDFRDMVYDTKHWDYLYSIDFWVDSRSRYAVSFRSQGPETLRQRYINRYKSLKHRIKFSKDTFDEWDLRLQVEEQAHHIGFWIDFFQVRLLIILPIVSLFVTILMFALNIDRYIDISYWMCGVPLFFVFLYVLVMIIWAYLLSLHSVDIIDFIPSIECELWKNSTGPLISIFKEEEITVKQGLSLVLSSLILWSTQLFLICWKMEYYNDTNKSISWGWIFIPIWLFSVWLCLSPWVVEYDSGIFLIGLLCWLPFLGFMIGLTVKLDDIQHHNPSDEMAAYFFPFWLIDAIVLLGSLANFIYGYIRSLNGLDSLENYAGILIIAWILFSPFAIFQALVSVRDSGYSGNSSSNSVYSITATEAVSPLLTLVGTICVVAVISVFLYRTPREMRWEINRDNRISNVPLYPL